MRSLSPILVVALTATLAACNWVPLKPEAKAIRVLAQGTSTDGCERRGEIGVSVKKSIALYQRNPLRVRDELETQARNEALGINANTIQPMTDPLEGSQWFSAWQCRAR
ncbi:MAG: DUF4156 domain-containing protein [Xanthomonadaceae bacterium]|jgi:hypothetical protein|nr:DUF4156 domain-containing protein [Xanthomonadaceae bacterium]